MEDELESKELTKRFMFFVIRKLVYFPFDRYQEFVDWIRLKGYYIPPHLTFENSELYNEVLKKVEWLNRHSITCGMVDASKLFSKQRPFIRDNKEI